MHKRLALALTAALLALLAIGAAPAPAAVIHPLEGSFNGADSDAGAFTSFQPLHVTVDQSSGDVFVLDPGNPDAGKNDAYISRFDAAGVAQDFPFPESSSISVTQTCTEGVPMRSSQDIAVDGSDGPNAGNIYVSGVFYEGRKNFNAVCAYNSAGEFLWKLTQFSAVCGVTVDGTGHLWVADAPSGGLNSPVKPAVKKFSSEGSPPSMIGSVPTDDRGCRPALDPGNNLYVVRGGPGPLEKYRLGSLERTIEPEQTEVVDVATDLASGHVYARTSSRFSEFDAEGNLISRSPVAGFELETSIAVNGATNTVYSAGLFGAVKIFGPHVPIPDAETGPATGVGHAEATLTGEVGISGGPDVETCRFEWGTDTNYGNTIPCEPGVPFSSDTTVSAELSGLTAETTYHYRLVAGNSNGEKEGVDRTFTPRAVADVVTDAATSVTTNSATLNGSLDPDGMATDYYFEYGIDTTYGFTTSATPAGSAAGSTPASAAISDLAEGQVYNFRLVASNELGTTHGPNETFSTAQPPTIDSFYASEVGAESALLNARINPHGSATAYHFEWGSTAAFGQRVPVPDGEIPAGNEPVDVSVRIEGLEPGVTYYFRVVATNEIGTRTTPGQTFDYAPPLCPNAALRQQTGAGYLPDCRAYELVSPANAGGTTLYSGGPSAPDATSPSRMAFVGAYGQIPGTNNPINNSGDLYLSTRTSEGWETNYIGLPASEASAMTGFPSKTNGPPDDTQDRVLTNESMDTILNWSNGLGLQVSAGWGASVQDENNQAIISNAPYVWNADGTLKDRWPTNLGVTDVEYYACPTGPGSVVRCTTFRGDMNASDDLSKLVFSSRYVAFAPGGLTEAPGSAYVNDTVNGDTTLISRLPNGEDIQLDPGQTVFGFDPVPGESIRISDVSENGSHVVMSSPTCLRVRGELCPGAKTHLYVNVDGAVTYPLAEGNLIERYVGMTDDGSKIYFLSSEQLTADDTDASVDLFMWESADDSYTRISAGGNGNGNSDACNASWTSGCGVQAVLQDCLPNEDRCSTEYWKGGLLGSESGNWSDRPGGAGGSGLTDNSIAGETGDIFFYSPERLDGSRGIDGQQNLYIFRDGEVRFVDAMSPGQFCMLEQMADFCMPGPVLRVQLSANGRKAAFLTASPMTSYDNAGKPQMYTYDTDTGVTECASCLPSGAPPTSFVEASQNGLFMSDDGRAFFSTKDSLVPQDTNGIRDVYEYVGGTPRLISAGTGAVTAENGTDYAAFFEGRSLPGLTGVSRDGRDVYFATYDVLVGQDNNGNQLKFYDARTNGGFPYLPPPLPCAAADECHGVGATTLAAPAIGTQANFGAGGNQAAPKKKTKRSKKAKKRSAKKRSKRAKARRKARRRAKAARRKAMRAARRGGVNRG